MSAPVRRGHIFWVPDSAIQLPPNSKRVLHNNRPFLVMSADESNADPSWPVVFGFPLSTSSDRNTKFDVPLPRGAGGVTNECFVLVPLAQPIAKSKLGNRLGQLDSNLREAVIARFLFYLGEIG